jgi:hypothetical protein
MSWLIFVCTYLLYDIYIDNPIISGQFLLIMYIICSIQAIPNMFCYKKNDNERHFAQPFFASHYKYNC